MAFEDKKQAPRIRRKKTCWFTENNVKFINGQRSLDEYDAYRDQLKSMGIETCIKLQQAALDRYNAR